MYTFVQKIHKVCFLLVSCHIQHPRSFHVQTKVSVSRLSSRYKTLLLHTEPKHHVLVGKLLMSPHLSFTIYPLSPCPPSQTGRAYPLAHPTATCSHTKTVACFLSVGRGCFYCDSMLAQRANSSAVWRVCVCVCVCE